VNQVKKSHLFSLLCQRNFFITRSMCKFGHPFIQNNTNFITKICSNLKDNKFYDNEKIAKSLTVKYNRYLILVKVLIKYFFT
jgi:hypothetical protein